MSRVFSQESQVRWYRIEPGDGTSYKFGIIMIPHIIGRDIVTGCLDDKYAMLIPADPGVVFDAPMIAFRDMSPSKDMFNKHGIQVCSGNNDWTMNFIAGIWHVLMADVADTAVLEAARAVIVKMNAGETFLG